MLNYMYMHMPACAYDENTFVYLYLFNKNMFFIILHTFLFLTKNKVIWTEFDQQYHAPIVLDIDQNRYYLFVVCMTKLNLPITKLNLHEKLYLY